MPCVLNGNRIYPRDRCIVHSVGYFLWSMTTVVTLIAIAKCLLLSCSEVSNELVYIDNNVNYDAQK